MSLGVRAGTAVLAVDPVRPEVPHPYWTMERVAQALGTAPWPALPLAGISTDTRTLRPGDCFVALVGEHHDAHDHLAQAKAAGAAALVVEDATRAVGLGLPTCVVTDTLVALGQLATAWRRAWGGTVVAVAGSNGKTSTKELLRAALGAELPVHATHGNLNNRVGVPLTLLAIPAHATMAVVEVGTNMPGEVGLLRAVAEPEIAVVTSIGEEHLEGLGDLQGVLREEAEILHGVALAVIPSAHPELEPLARARAQQVVRAGLPEQGMAELVPAAWGLDGDGCPWFDLDGVRGTLPLRGAHQAANAMLALAVARACGVSTVAATHGMAAMPVPSMRGVWTPIGRAVLLNDAYNANPASMRAALALLAAVGSDRQRVAILGTMRELGPQSGAQHRAVARAALDSPADLLVGLGEFAKAFADEGVDARVITCDTLDEIWPLLEPRLAADALILLKASRGTQLERLVPQLTTWATR